MATSMISSSFFTPRRSSNSSRKSTAITASSNTATRADQSLENKNAARKGEVLIVGAGPAGCLMAFFCIKRGFHVHLFEKRQFIPDQYVGSDSRSYPMLLSCRAVQALEAAEIQVPSSLMGTLLGGCVHLPNGRTRVFKYSSSSNLTSYGVSRNSFVRYLQETLLERYPEDVSAHFGWELSSIDDGKSVAVFQSSVDQSTQAGSMELRYDLLVGADGVSSKTRAEMLKLEKNDKSESEKSPLTMKFTPNPERYKSFYVHPTLAKASPLYAHHNYVQSWPSLNMLLVGMADGSFWGGSKNPELLNASTAAEIDQIFRTNAPEVYELLLQQNSDFPQDYLKRPSISFGGAVILSRFHRRNILLIGDAAHAMFPSYGTGCNVALEDCLLFDQIMQELEDKEGTIDCSKAAQEFTSRRLSDAHAIVEMNSDLRLLPRGFWGILQTTILTTLRKIFPSLLNPSSYQLLWSHVPFTAIKQQKRKEDVLFYSLLAAVAAIAVLAVSALVVQNAL